MSFTLSQLQERLTTNLEVLEGISKTLSSYEGRALSKADRQTIYNLLTTENQNLRFRTYEDEVIKSVQTHTITYEEYRTLAFGENYERLRDLFFANCKDQNKLIGDWRPEKAAEAQKEGCIIS